MRAPDSWVLRISAPVSGYGDASRPSLMGGSICASNRRVHSPPVITLLYGVYGLVSYYCLPL